MSEISEVPREAKPKTLSRREFLKVAGLTLGAVTGAKLIKERDKKEVFSIKTKEGEFFPIYEEHTKPLPPQELEKFPTFNVMMYELARFSFTDYAKFDNLENVESDYAPTESHESKPIIRKQHLPILKERGTSVAFEGNKYPEDLYSASLLRDVGKRVGGVILGVNYALNKTTIDEKLGSKKDYAKTLVTAGVTWAESTMISDALNIPLYSGGTEAQQGALQRVVANVTSLINHANPDNHTVFLRNILMTRRLQFIGEHATAKQATPAKIGYEVGATHAGMEDFLILGKEVTLDMLNMYPKEVLEKYVDENGGIENFSSVVLFSAKEKYDQKNVLKDKELIDLLRKKLKRID